MERVDTEKNFSLGLLAWSMNRKKGKKEALSTVTVPQATVQL